MAELFITIVFMIPVYGILLWSYFSPEESILFGKRWMYKEEPELSSGIIRYTKFASIVSMVALPIVIFSIFSEILILRFSLVLYPLVIIFGALFILTGREDA